MTSTEHHMHEWHSALINNGASLNDAQYIVFPESPHHATPEDAHPLCVYLQQLSCIEITGADAQDFLQGQLSCDMNTISNTLSGIGSHNNLKGRMISSFRILKTDTSYYLIIDQSIADDCVAQLKKYAVFSDVRIEINPSIVFIGVQSKTACDELHISSHANGAVLATSTAHIMSIHQQSSRCMIITQVEHAHTHWEQLLTSCTPANHDAWTAMDINDGLTWVTHSTQDLFLPQSVNYHLIGGVSFTKGCYIGQEVIVRTQHRGKIKRVLCRLLVNNPSNSTLTPGCALHCDGKPVGVIASSAHIGDTAYLLAVLHIDYVDSIDRLCDERDQPMNIKALHESTPHAIT